MGLFGNLTNDGLEETQDRLGGGGAKETDIYLATIKYAYAMKSQGGAQGVALEFTLEGAGDYRETVYVTNKKGENYFLNKDDKTKKVPLPGFTIIDDMCVMTTDKPLSEQADEEKTIKVYDFDEKKELPKSVPMLIDLVGKQVYLAIQKTLENKKEKQGDDYVAIADEVERNNIVKVFHNPTKMSVVEARRGASEPEFFDKWLEKNKGQTYDKREIKDGAGGNAGRPGSNKTPPQAGNAAPRASLFGKK